MNARVRWNVFNFLEIKVRANERARARVHERVQVIMRARDKAQKGGDDP